MSERTWRLALGALAAVAIGLRIAFLFAVEPPVQEISDAGYYYLLGQHLADGEGYLRPYDLALYGDRIPTAEFPPLLPLVLAGSSIVGLDTMLDQRALLCLAGGATVVLIALLARRLAGRPAGLLAGGVAAVHPALVGADTSLMTEGLGALLVAALLLSTLWLLDAPGPRRAAVVGLLGGLMALLRGEGVLLLAGLAAVIGVVLLARERRRLLTVAAALAVAAGVVVAPWLIRNLRTFDTVVMSNNLGSVLAGSYCDETFAGPWVGSWRLTPTCFDGYGYGQDRSEAEGSAAIRAEALRYARSHAGDLPRVAAIRVARTFGLWDLDQQVRLAALEARDARAERASAYLTWALLIPAAVGAIVVARREAVRALVLAVPVVTSVAVTAATYGNQRFRVGTDVVLIVLAAVAVAEAARWRRRRRPAATG